MPLQSSRGIFSFTRGRWCSKRERPLFLSAKVENIPDATTLNLPPTGISPTADLQRRHPITSTAARTSPSDRGETRTSPDEAARHPAHLREGSARMAQSGPATTGHEMLLDFTSLGQAFHTIILSPALSSCLQVSMCGLLLRGTHVLPLLAWHCSLFSDI